MATVRLSMYLTVGVVLDQANQRGISVDVELISGRRYEEVTVASLEQFSVVLLDERMDGRAHVIAREHIAAVSMRRGDLLEIED